MRPKISAHISYNEATRSQTATRKGINNTPNQEQLKAMHIVAEMIFEPLRKHFDVPLGVSSFFRCEELNKAIGGSKTSQHVKGEAIDIDADIFGGVTNRELFNYIKNNLLYDQLIWEFGGDPFEEGTNPAWVHVSFSNTKNRKQILVARRSGGRVKYVNYSP